jgi:hypothetical protein
VHLSRKLIIPAIAAGALMVAAPTVALASTSSAATAPAVTLSAARNIPAGGYHWAYYNSYNTLTQCQDTGENILFNNGWDWKCVQTEGIGGYDWEYDLYIWIGSG